MDEPIILGNSKTKKDYNPPEIKSSMDSIVKNKVIVNSSISDNCKIGKYTVKDLLAAIIAHGITP